MTTTGYDSADTTFAARLDLALEVAGEALERLVELAGQLGRLEDAHVVVGERLGVLAGGGGERPPLRRSSTMR